MYLCLIKIPILLILLSFLSYKELPLAYVNWYRLHLDSTNRFYLVFDKDSMHLS